MWTGTYDQDDNTNAKKIGKAEGLMEEKWVQSLNSRNQRLQAPYQSFKLSGILKDTIER